MGNDYYDRVVTFRRQELVLWFEDSHVYRITSRHKVARPTGCSYCGCDGMNGKHCVMCLGLVPALLQPAKIADRQVGKLRHVLEQQGIRRFGSYYTGTVDKNPHEVDAKIRTMLRNYRRSWAEMEAKLAQHKYGSDRSASSNPSETSKAISRPRRSTLLDRFRERGHRGNT
ncbi:MAG: hypothetical protein U0517_03120 [Candidatus Andersenbacteria bacterium]